MKKFMPVLFILALAALTWLGFVGGQYFYEQSLVANGNAPGTSASLQIMETINRAYEIQREGGRTFNFDRFDQVFINDPRFPMPPGTLQVVREMTYNPSLETAGFLDYKLAYYTWWRDSILKKEALEGKAKAENRELTDEERRSLVDQYGRSAPARPPQNLPEAAPALKFLSIEINGEIAIAKLDDGPTIVQYTLVLVNHRWYIADMKILMVDA
ncbi:MAG: hypothetical protein C4583_08935 [Anaerolineaceae bacterium]|nr:MAG: hypothetical protein C4583_08935 [Anaerolineaceae bacterium]